MIHLLRRHPFGVEAFFRRSLVLTYALPRDVLTPLIGPGLEVDHYDGPAGPLGFLAIALVETTDLRPRGFPEWMGKDFFLSGYRIFTRFVRPGKQTLRGLRILRSDTDRKMMTGLGNLFTHYKYRLARVDVENDGPLLEIRVRTEDREADLHVIADLASQPAPLPDGSPFRSMEDALSFAGPLPYTFDREAETGKMVVIKGLRQAWDPQPVRVDVKVASFLEHPPYAWKPGTLEDVP